MVLYVHKAHTNEKDKTKDKTRRSLFKSPWPRYATAHFTGAEEQKRSHSVMLCRTSTPLIGQATTAY